MMRWLAVRQGDVGVALKTLWVMICRCCNGIPCFGLCMIKTAMMMMVMMTMIVIVIVIVIGIVIVMVIVMVMVLVMIMMTTIGDDDDDDHDDNNHLRHLHHLHHHHHRGRYSSFDTAVPVLQYRRNQASFTIPALYPSSRVLPLASAPKRFCKRQYEKLFLVSSFGGLMLMMIPGH
jgi:hypothetical protein